MAHDPVAFKKTKHILRAANFLRDLVARRYFTVVKIAGEDNVADMLTKPVSVAVYRRLVKSLQGIEPVACSVQLRTSLCLCQTLRVREGVSRPTPTWDTFDSVRVESGPALVALPHISMPPYLAPFT